MKKLFVYLFTMLSILVSAQDELSSLQAPTSPASGIIDLQPSVVLMPKTYQSLETALYSNFIGSNGKLVIPKDFAIEFTPYWTKNHGLSLKEYLYPKFFEQLKRSSSISLASSQSFALGNGTLSSAVGFGYRANFFMGNKNDRKKGDDLSEKLIYNQNIAVSVSGIANRIRANAAPTSTEQFISLLKPDIAKDLLTNGVCQTSEEANNLVSQLFKQESTLPQYDQANPQAFLSALTNMIDNAVKGEALFDQFESYIKKRQGWSMDVAAASFINYPTINNTNLSYLPKASLWLTPTYRLKDEWSNVQIAGVVRYEWYNNDYYTKFFPNAKIFENNWDIGIAASFDAKKVTGKIELVGRRSQSKLPSGDIDENGNQPYVDDVGSDLQFLGSINYAISEQVMLTYTYGNKFDSVTNPNSNLVSTLTLNFGFLPATKSQLDLNNNSD